MQVDDYAIFQEYYDLKVSEGIPLSYFLKSHHLLISERKFYLRYLAWLTENDKKDIYHNSLDFLLWILDHMDAPQTVREHSLSLLLSLEGNRIRNKNKSFFSSLVIATSTFFMSNGSVIPSLLEDVGLSQTTVEDCMKRIIPTKTRENEDVRVPTPTG